MTFEGRKRKLIDKTWHKIISRGGGKIPPGRAALLKLSRYAPVHQVAYLPRDVCVVAECRDLGEGAQVSLVNRHLNTRPDVIMFFF